MINLGYIMLGGKVLFDDPFALTPRIPAAAAIRPDSHPAREPAAAAGDVSGPDGAKQARRHIVSKRQREIALIYALAKPEVRDGFQIIASDASEPVLFTARSRNPRYTGEIGGVWFEEGATIVGQDKVEKLAAAGCKIELCGG